MLGKGGFVLPLLPESLLNINIRVIMATTPPFKYQPMFEKGKDTTEYYLLTKDYVSVSEFEGKPILKIEKKV